MKHLIIGLGSIGKRHAQILMANGQDVAGVDIHLNREFNFPAYDNLESGWKTEPDMVWVCTPTNLHAEHAVEALNRGLHVFIEKPLAHSIESAKTVQGAWEKMAKKSVVWVGCNMRFHPGVIRLKKAIDKGLIGSPLIFRIHFSHYLPNMRPETDYRNTYAAHAEKGGGIILDDIHDIDLALWFAGPVKSSSGIAINSGTLDMDVEDIANLSLLHSSGVFSEIHMDFLRRVKSRGIEVTGENGTLQWQSHGKNPETAVLNLFKTGEKNVRSLWSEQLTDFDEMFRQQWNSILKAVNEPEKHNACLTEAMETLRIALDVRKNRLY